jgi:hypothetical protein
MGLANLSIREDDQKRLREEFGDDGIYYGRNHKDCRFETWYKPRNSRPYLIATPSSIAHAIYLLRQRIENDRKGAKLLLREIDAHNKKLLTDKEADAMDEVKHDLKWIASGRKTFAPSLAGSRDKICRLTTP